MVRLRSALSVPGQGRRIPSHARRDVAALRTHRQLDHCRAHESCEPPPTAIRRRLASRRRPRGPRRGQCSKIHRARQRICSVRERFVGISPGPLRAGGHLAAGIGAKDPQSSRPAAGAGDDPLPLRLSRRSQKGTRGRHRNLRLERIARRPRHSLDESHPSPRGRAADPSKPAGVP